MDRLGEGVSRDSDEQRLMKEWLNKSLFPKMLACEKQIKNMCPTTSDCCCFHSRKRKSHQYKPKKQQFYRHVKVHSRPPYEEFHQTTHETESDEIDTEYKKFRETTAKHQEARKVFKDLEEEKEYILDTTGPVQMPAPSDKAPDQHPAYKRKEHLISLYGSQAHKIQSMEIHLQAQFDQKVDTINPSYWPVIPLKL